MTTDDLIEFLKDHPGKKIVVSSDAEGNGYSPLSDADEAKYVAESTWSGQLLHPEDIDAGEYEDDYVESAEEVVVLWPVN